MKKETYERASSEIIKIDGADVIVTSPNTTPIIPNPNSDGNEE